MVVAGEAAHCRGVGLRRIEVWPGGWSTPAHEHGREEEIFFVLAGNGLSWQGGGTHEIRAGDCIVYHARRGAHTVHAFDEGLDVLAFGPRLPDESVGFPRSGFSLVGGRGVESVDGSAAGRQRSAAHCHSAEEELFVVLEGTLVLELIPSPNAAQFEGAESEHHDLCAGNVVSRPPGTRIAHKFTAGPDGATYLAYGTREPNDIAYYPEEGKLAFRGVGVSIDL